MNQLRPTLVPESKDLLNKLLPIYNASVLSNGSLQNKLLCRREPAIILYEASTLSKGTKCAYVYDKYEFTFIDV